MNIISISLVQFKKSIKVLLIQVVLTCFIFMPSFSQKIYGKIYNDNGDLLPFSSVTIKSTSSGVTANKKADYIFSLHPGKYTLVCQHIGYEAIEKNIELVDDMELNFILKPQILTMKELVITSGDENPAYEIIRQSIKKRNFYNNQVNGFEVDMYGKDVIKLRNLPDKIFGKKLPKEDRSSMGLDSSGKGIVYLSEAISKVHSQLPDKFKMEVLSSRVSGSNSFGFTFPAFINLYANNVTIFKNGFNPRGFVSPIADGALRFYKYKMMGTFIENGKVINTIKVTPRRDYEPLFSGIINICDDDWRIQSFDFIVTKKSQLEFLDTLQITQLHVPVGNEIWRVKNQFLYFNFKMLGIDVIGNFLTVYSDYKINPVFDKKFFDRIIIKYDTAVNKKSKSYWDTIRPVPLEYEEKQDYKFKDSVFQLQLDSTSINNNIDTLKKRQGKIKILQAFFPGINRTYYSKEGNFQWGIAPLLSNTFYNTAEGLSVQLGGYFEKYYPKCKSDILIQPNIRYGFSNTHLNSWVDVLIKKKIQDEQNTIIKNSWILSAGKRIAQYNNLNPIDPFVNSLSTLLDGKNVMKIYEKYYGLISFQKKYESGFRFSIKTFYEDRMPIFNTTNYTFYKKESVNITENYPVDRMAITDLIRHQAFVANIELSFKPGQRYIQLPHSKIAMGSNYPTFTLNYTKGIKNIFKSDVDYDKWNLDISDDKNLKLAGTLKYKFSTGGFLNSSKLFIQDYKHFNSNSIRATSAYVDGFQLMSSYLNSNFAKFYFEGHLEHHFNGLFTNKIPRFNKLNWYLVAGTNSYFINNSNNYAELFIGLENIFKLFRVDFVSGYQNGKYTRSSLVLGASGLLGTSLSSKNTNASGSHSVSISF